MYLAETELKHDLNIYIALTNIYGLSNANSHLICKKLGFSNNLKVKDLTNVQKDKLTRFLNTSTILLNTELKKKKILIQQKSIDIKLYKGLRKLNGYPVRGQRTRSNARTAKKKNF